MTGPTSGRGLVVETGRAAMLLALASAGVCAGCDHFRVESFHGSKILLTLAGERPTEPDLSHSAVAQGPSGVLAVMRRIHQITDEAPLGPLLVLASWDDQSGARRPGVDDAKVANARDRLQQCCEYWCDSPFAYSGNVF